jgi:hypothetical protein
MNKGGAPNVWKGTTNGAQAGDQVRAPAEEDGKESDHSEDSQKEISAVEIDPV